MQPSDPSLVHQLAERLLNAYDDPGQSVDPEPDHILDSATINALQAAVCEVRGPVGGFKCGRQGNEIAPISAPVMANRLYASGATVPAAHSRLRGVELEMGFRLTRALPAPDDPDFSRILRSGVELIVALEIVESRLLDHDSVHPTWKLADMQSNGGIVIGDTAADAWPASLDHAKIRLAVRSRNHHDDDARILHDRTASVPGGDAFETFVAFARRTGDHCGGLQPGQVVITGSMSGVDYLQAGDLVTASIDGIGSAGIRFEPVM